VRWTLQSPENVSWGSGRLLSGDLDGNNTQDLVWYHGPCVRAIRGKDGHVMWDHAPGPDPGARVDVIAIDPPHHSVGATVITRVDRSLFGRDGATGEIRWRSEPSESDPVPLATSDPSGIPRILDSTPDRTVCRLAMAADRSTMPTLRTPGPVNSRRSSVRDPRLARPLPWTSARLLTSSLLMSAGISLVALVLPAVIFVWAFRRRTWSLRRALVIPIVLGFVLTLFRVLGPMITSGLIDNFDFNLTSFAESRYVPAALRESIRVLLVCIQGLPIVAFVLVLFGIIRNPKARQSRWRLALFTLLAIACAGALLAVDWRTPGADWYYRLDGWPWVFVLPAYLTGAVLLVSALLRVVIRTVARFMFSHRVRTSPRFDQA
jgi:hypothetical protein